jgi:putative ABC transport system permease protein
MTWVIRRAARLWPADFRRTYADDFLQTYEGRRARTVTRAGRLRVDILALCALLGLVVTEHWSHTRHRASATTVKTSSAAVMAWRGLVRRPASTGLIVLTLGVSLGGAMAVGTAFDALARAGREFPDSAHLLIVDEVRHDGRPGFVSARSYAAWREGLPTAQIAAANPWTEVNVEWPGGAERVPSASVTPSYFDVTGVRPLLGRLLTPEDVGPDAPDVVVVDERWWHTRLNGDPSVIGRPLHVHGKTREIVGVVPSIASDGRVTAWAGLWIPLKAQAVADLDSPARWLRVLVRPAPGQAPHVSEAIRTIQAQLASSHPQTHAGRHALIRPVATAEAGDLPARLSLLSAAAGVLLLIGVTNAACLVSARRATMAADHQVHTALGAAPSHLRLRAAMDGLYLGAASGILATGCAAGLATALPLLAADTWPAAFQISISARVMVAAMVLAMLLGVLLTGVRAVRTPPTLLGVRHGRHHIAAPLRTALIATQVALSVVLLCAAGIVGRSVLALAQVHPGFEPDGLVALAVSLPPDQYRTSTDRQQYFFRVTERLRALPGVRAVGGMDYLPLEGGWQKPAVPAPLPWPSSGEDEVFVYSKPVLPETFAALGIPIIAGRTITESEVLSQAPVLVIDQTMAAQYWPGTDPLGRQIRHAASGPAMTVVGVVGAVTQQALDVPAPPTAYHPYPGRADLHLLVRTTGVPDSAVPMLLRALSEVDPLVPAGRIRTGHDLLARSVRPWTTDLGVLALCTVTAVMMAGIGIFGLLANLVATQRSEIGVRLALGATPARIRRDITQHTQRSAVLGVITGAPLALLVAQVAQVRRFSVPTVDPGSWLGIVLLVTIVCWLASWAPARRAAAIDPAGVLRGQ